MKKTFLFLTLILSIYAGKAQINFETEYGHSGTFTKLALSGYKFYIMDVGLSQCRIYNTDHSLWKTIDLPIPKYNYLYDIKFVSENLFTMDNKVCLAYIYYFYDEVTMVYSYTAKVLKEDGTELLDIPGANYLSAFNLEENGTKMLAFVYDYALSYYPKTRVYNLPGDLLSASDEEGISSFGLNNPFPNPAHEFTNVPYELPKDRFEGILTISDLNGRVIDTFRIDNNFKSLHLSTLNYKQGTYLYYITSGNYTSETKKLFVQ
jgi:hypothetical protein